MQWGDGCCSHRYLLMVDDLRARDLILDMMQCSRLLESAKGMQCHTLNENLNGSIRPAPHLKHDQRMQ